MEKEKFFEEMKKYVGIIEITNEPDLTNSKYSGFLIQKNMVLTSCHCVTPSKKDNQHYEIIPSNVSFKVQGHVKKVIKIYRFQNYNSSNQIIPNLVRLYKENKDELQVLRNKLKHSLDFSILIVEEVSGFDMNFLLLPEGNQKNHLVYSLFGYNKDKFESIELKNFKEESEEIGIFSFNPFRLESLRGGVVIACSNQDYYLYGLNTSSLNNKEVKEKGIRLTKFLKEIEYHPKGKYNIEVESEENKIEPKLKTMETITVFSKNKEVCNSCKEPFFSYYMPHIETLILEDNYDLPDPHYFLSLKSLIINNYKRLIENFQKKLYLLIELKELKLCNIGTINFSELFKKYKSSKLESLILKGVSLNKDSLKFVAQTQSISYLKELNLSYNNLTFSIDLFLFIERMKTLKKLDLSFNQIDNKGLNSLSFCFKSLINLTHINLSFLKLNQEEKLDSFNQNLCNLFKLEELIFLNKRVIIKDEFHKSLTQLKSLKKLDLSHVEFRNFDNNISGLCRTLSSLSTLTSINLDSISLDSIGLTNLLEIVNIDFVEISLKRNNLTDDSVNTILKYMEKNLKLKNLDLSFNKFNGDSLMKFAKSLNNLKELEVLKLENSSNLYNDEISLLLKEINLSKIKLKFLNVYFTEPIKDEEYLKVIAGTINEMTSLNIIKMNCSRELQKYLTTNCKLINR